MKKLTQQVYKKVVLWSVGITIAIIPLSALAAYMTQPVEQKTLSYKVCESGGDCKVVAEITPAPLPRYEQIYNEYRAQQHQAEVSEGQQRIDEYLKSEEYRKFVKGITG